MLKTLKPSPSDTFNASLDEAQEWASAVGYKEQDINEIIASVRDKKRSTV